MQRPTSRRPSLRTATYALCLGLIVLGIKWAVFDRFGSAMPDWDQWDAEGSALLAPWYENDRPLAHIFEPHNEHRIVMTKVQNLTLTVLNGQWDSRVEAISNAVLHTLMAVAFWLVGIRWLRRAATTADPAVDRSADSAPLRLRVSEAALFVLVVVLFGMPIAWQNVLGGFHSQQYWLLLLSFAAMVALPFARTWSAGWWAAATAAVLALFTMGSGLLAPAIVFAVTAWRIVRRETTFRETWPTLLLTAALTVAGLLTRVEFAAHEPLKAKTVHDFVFSIVHSLQWPLRDQHWAGAVLWLPWAIITWRALAGPRNSATTHTTRAELTTAALGGWVLAQIVATAYARGAGADYPASRYMDTLAFGAAVNGLALCWLLCTIRRQRDGVPEGWIRMRVPGWRSVAIATLGIAWVTIAAVGLRTLIRNAFVDDVTGAKRYYLKAEAHVRGFLATNDPAHLAFPEIPYPSAESLIERLTRPSLRALMPAELRPSLQVAAARDESSASAGFRENHVSALALENASKHGLSPPTAALDSRMTWGSFAADGVKTVGEWTSEPITSPLGGWLRFDVAGDLGHHRAGTLELLLLDATTGARLASVQPDARAGDLWRPAYVRAPARAFVIRAIDRSTSGWFAFSAPAEVGPLSYAAVVLARQGVWLLVSGTTVTLWLALGFLATVTRREPNSAGLATPERSGRVADRASIIAIAACVFLVVWGIKLFAIGRYGSDLAFWDQWAKEADHLYTPWLERGEFWRNLILPHNEHRIAPTLALDLGIVAASGQWDSRVQCIVSAALHALIAAGLAAWGARHLTRRWALAGAALIALVAGSCIAVDNVITGFQSQFYFLAGFSLLAIGGLLSTPAFSWRWWLGFAAGALALVSMGSGFLFAAPIVVIAAARWWSGGARRSAVATTLAALLLGGVGVWLRTPTPWHDNLAAQTPAQFFSYAVRCLAWPWHGQPWFAVVVWAPWVLLLLHRWRVVSQRSAAVPTASVRFSSLHVRAADFVLAGGGWVLVQVAAVSYARGGGGGLPAARYGDIFGLGVMFAFLALALLAAAVRHPLARAAGALWATVAAAAVLLAARPVWQEQLPHERATRLLYEQNVEHFLRTDDYETFEKQTLPFPIADWLARILRRAEIRAILPVSVQPHRMSQQVEAAGEWRGPTLPATTGWWKFETRGHLGLPGTALELRAASDNRLLALVAPTRVPGDGWRAAYAAAPREPALLVARTDDPARWFEFTDPVRMSALSYRAWRLSRNGHWLALVGVMGGVALGGWWGLRRGPGGVRPSDAAKRRESMTGTALPRQAADAAQTDDGAPASRAMPPPPTAGEKRASHG